MINLVDVINKYGFPIVACFGVAYMVFYVWTWVTKEIKPVLSESNNVLIQLIDRVRMLDNDLIRLTQRVNVVLSIKERNGDVQKDSNSKSTSSK